MTKTTGPAWVQVSRTADRDGWKTVYVTEHGSRTAKAYRSKTVDGEQVWEKQVRTLVDIEGALDRVVEVLTSAGAGLVDPYVDVEREYGYYDEVYTTYYVQGWADLDEKGLVALKAEVKRYTDRLTVQAGAAPEQTRQELESLLSL